MADIKDITEIMMVLQTAYPNTELGEYTPRLYLELLQDIPSEVLKNAVLHCISKSPFYPKISEIRRAAAEIRLNNTNIPTAHEAWGMVSRAIPAYGRNSRPEFPHRLIDRTVSALGWYNLCISTNQIADRARFIEAYDIFREKDVDEVVVLQQVKDLAERLASPTKSDWYALPETSEVEDEQY